MKNEPRRELVCLERENQTVICIITDEDKTNRSLSISTEGAGKDLELQKECCMLTFSKKSEIIASDSKII